MKLLYTPAATRSEGGDHKRQILLSYYESDEPVDEITFSRTKRAKIDEVSEPNQGGEVIEVAAEHAQLPEGGEVE